MIRGYSLIALLMMSSAASAQGLALPGEERVAALLQAGVTRAQALEGYSTIARTGALVQGAVQRANLGSKFNQDDFEKARD